MNSTASKYGDLWLDAKVEAIKSAGVDAITMVATSSFGNAELRAIWNGWLQDCQEDGRIAPWYQRDVRGQQYASMKIGSGKNGMLMLQTLGNASRYVLDVHPSMSEQRLTRCDLCVDVHYVDGNAPDIEKWYNHPRVKKINGEHRKYWKSPTGDTLYLGNRRSGSYVRIYDKGLEYKLGLKQVYRFEVEYKRVQAKRIQKLLECGDFDITHISLQLVRETARGKGILAPWNTLGQDISIPRVEIGLTTDDTRLAWIKQISGAIREFVYKSEENEKVVREIFNLPMFEDGSIVE